MHSGSRFAQPGQEEFRRVAESHRVVAVVVMMMIMVMIMIILLYVCLRGTYIARSISKVKSIACAVELLPAYDLRRHA
jgi:hypothetical protein